ncbi:hypothetical protein [Metabacillus fastidiosus]|uniref:hypothetical protein n=1 Tax=Metabacillus fastidiosus TaxID=1458 RepID=UPI003D2A9C14
MDKGIYCSFCRAELKGLCPKVREFVYLELCERPFQELEFFHTNIKTGAQYVGRAKRWERYVKRQKEHARKNKANYNYKVLTRTKPGRQAKRYEQKFINRYGGPKRHGGRLENDRHEISPKK